MLYVRLYRYRIRKLRCSCVLIVGIENGTPNNKVAIVPENYGWPCTVSLNTFSRLCLVGGFPEILLFDVPCSIVLVDSYAISVRGSQGNYLNVLFVSELDFGGD